MWGVRAAGRERSDRAGMRAEYCCVRRWGPGHRFFCSSRRRHTRLDCDWSSDVCSSDLNRSARKQLLRALELDPTLERRYQAARAAWRLGDMPVVSEEMERVRAEAAEQGDHWCESRSLAALSEVALNRGADVSEADRLARLALEVADADDREPRFDALHVLYTGAWWRGRLSDADRYAREQLELAQEAGRADRSEERRVGKE